MKTGLNISETVQARRGKLGSAILLVGALLLPKCAVCVAGYAVAFFGLGRAGVELCGGNPNESQPHLWLWLGVAAAASVIGWSARKFFRRASITCPE